MEKMYKTSTSLQEFSLNFICDNINDFIEEVEEHKETSEFNRFSPTRYRFRNPELRLPYTISEILMEKLNKETWPHDAAMLVFNSKQTMLKNVRLRDCYVGQAGLQVLKQHNISTLVCSNPSRGFSISNVLGSLNEWTIANLTEVNFSKCLDFDCHSTRDILRTKIPIMKNLKNLNLSWTKLDQISLEAICKGLESLQKLDISGTLVNDLRPLIQFSDRLTSLSIANLFNAKFYAHTILQLNKLRYLDVSIHKRWVKIRTGTSMSDIPLYDVLADKHSLPELRFLDISGWRNHLPATTVVDYVAAHPKLGYLGCVQNNIASDIGLQNVAPRGLDIGGMDNEQQIKVALVVYRYKPSYVTKLLWRLRYLTSQFPEPDQETFDLILSVMAAHPSHSSLLMKATDCLYNLTRDVECSRKIHSKALDKAAKLMTLAMKRVYPESFDVENRYLMALSNISTLRSIQSKYIK